MSDATVHNCGTCGHSCKDERGWCPNWASPADARRLRELADKRRWEAYRRERNGEEAQAD